jgi:predicted amidophosphoribosyltransferase
MFCKHCYADLTTTDQTRCPRCGRAFNPAEPKSYLLRPFPPAARIIFHLIAATIVAVLVAFFVAFFQLAQASGH